MKTKIIIISGFLLWAISGMSQSEKKHIREGNNLFTDGNFAEAEVEYRKALEAKPGYPRGTFNLGDALFEQENFEESGKLFGEVAESNLPETDKSNAYYNLGNSLLKEKKFKESIEAYKETLRRNPADENARYNLEYARQMLKQQQQQEQQQQQNQDQNKDQENKDDQKQDQQDQKDQKDNQDQKDKEDQQDQKDQEQKDQKDQQDQQKNQQDQNQKDQQQQQQQPQQISKQDAQRMLEALKNDEKATLQKLQKQKAKAVRGHKSDIDW
jgi:tetratricopeptide (TPR) repeat protein